MLRTGAGAGVTATPTPNHQRRGTCGIRQGLPFAQLRPALLALGGWRGRRRPRVTGTAEKTSWNPQSRDLRGHSAPPQGLALEPAPQGRGWERAPLGLLCGCRAPALGWREAVFLHERKSSPSGAPGSTGRSAPPPRGDGNRKDATVWGFNIPNGKNTRKLYSIFPVKVIILHRTKKSKKHAGSERRPASGAAEAGDAVQLLSGVLFSVCFRGLASVRPLSSH